MKIINNALKLNPAANESLISTLEDQASVMLPAAFRRFLNLANGAKIHAGTVINVITPHGIKQFRPESIMGVTEIISERRKATEIPSHFITISQDKTSNRILLDLIRGHIIFKERQLLSQIPNERPKKLDRGIVLFDNFDAFISFISDHMGDTPKLMVAHSL